MTSADEWEVLCIICNQLDLGELNTKKSNSKQQGYLLSTDCNACMDGAIKLIAEELQHLDEKLPFIPSKPRPGRHGVPNPQPRVSCTPGQRKQGQQY